MTQRKVWILVLLGIAILAILALAASLAQLEFSPGDPFALGGLMPASQTPSGVSPELSPALALLLRVGLTLIMALLPFTIFYLLLTPEGRRRLFRNLIVLVVFLLLAQLLQQQLHSVKQDQALTSLGMMSPGEPTIPRQPAEFSGAAPSWLVIVLSFVLAAFIIALTAAVVYAIWRNRRQPRPGVALERLAQEAEQAIDVIQAGGDLRDTVIRCYVEMNRVVREARGILRQHTMTTREFEDELSRAGLPGEPIRDLTRLFEEVRYGAKELGPWEGRRATACLAAIAEACRSLAGQPPSVQSPVPTGS